MTSAQGSDARFKMLDWSDLPGWDADDHAAALTAFRDSCDKLKDDTWSAICGVAGEQKNARSFFELFFRPVEITGENPTLFTAYYEPELQASRVRTEIYRYALYARPPDMPTGQAWYTRQQLEDGGILQGRGLELAWLSDPVDRFFLHVQGSGRLRLTDGTSMRLGFAAKNGHQYRSVGQEMARRGVLPPNKLSAGSIKAWVRRNPEAGRRFLQHNPSYIFFRELNLPPEKGPVGAMGVSITTMRTVAVDPDFVPLGAPVWIEKLGVEPMTRLMVAQDTGSAIKGAGRADIFYGSGKDAGDRAGIVRDSGRMVVLFPIETALALADG
ncbi:MAG: murein transglycosylase A [Pseudomonadota bacterium]